jgi:hypothetical protein
MILVEEKIAMDNLNSQFGDAVTLLENAGHIDIFRPNSSLDFVQVNGYLTI